MTNLLAERILLCADAGIVVLESLGENLGVETHLIRQSLTATKPLHQTTADVMLTMPLDLLRSLTIKNKTDGILRDNRYSPKVMETTSMSKISTYFAVLPDLASDEVTMLQLVDETFSILINK